MLSSSDQLLAFFRERSRITVITGAGISAHSGIPTYRNDAGEWQRNRPIQHQEFINSEAYRQRYWSRSAVGWPPVARAQPNAAHRALAALEAAGKVSVLVTQNVDRLHQRAGHKNVIDLHGRLDRVICRDCGHIEDRDAVQRELLAQNPALQDLQAPMAPDGDADIDERIVSSIRSPRCRHCGGIPMPDVVFYGGSVPKPRVAAVHEALEQADALMVVGSSLQVYSAYRFCKFASARGIPVIAVNRGLTRADPLLALKVEADCGGVLEWLAASL